MYNVGSFGRPITTNNPEAQTWFNRGLTWTYGFNHQEAIHCFEQAIACDKSCAMAYWGLALALGPHYNKTWAMFGPELAPAVARTHQVARQALALSAEASAATAVEKALIEALQARYQSDVVSDVDKLAATNAEYADAMKKVYGAFSHDLDVAALFADAMISLTPWKLWDLVTGEPVAGARTLEAKLVLEKGFQDPASFQHPGILHIYIHLIEMSSEPELGLKAANCLRMLAPDVGHLTHMPSHLDVLVGDYASAIDSNRRAMAADEKFLAKEGALNFYTLYRMHDYHSLIYAAMFAGRKADALDAAERLEASLPREVVVSTGDFMESFMTVRWHVMVRFGMWDAILQAAVPAEPDLYSMTTAIARYAKSLAWAAKENIPEAERERTLYKAAVSRVPSTRLNYPNTCSDTLAVASEMLDGEIEYRRGNYAVAFQHLRRSIQLDDGLVFSEPWGWMQPARHACAALLAEQGQVEEAARLYKADLGLDTSAVRARRHPNNVWALHGYVECLLRLGQTAEAQKMEPALEAAVAFSDVPIASSCFCRLNTV